MSSLSVTHPELHSSSGSRWSARPIRGPRTAILPGESFRCSAHTAPWKKARDSRRKRKLEDILDVWTRLRLDCRPQLQSTLSPLFPALSLHVHRSVGTRLSRYSSPFPTFKRKSTETAKAIQPMRTEMTRYSFDGQSWYPISTDSRKSTSQYGNFFSLRFSVG